MRLKLKNYRSHKSREIDFPKTGFIKLGGRSGQGKSNIMRSLSFGLFDYGRNAITYGEKTCVVEIADFLEQPIFRQKGPNLLKFGELTGEAAQAEIESVLGMNELEFLTSSYVQQGLEKSLISCDPKDQLAMIYSLAFGETNPDDVRQKIKDSISSLNAKISSTETKRILLSRDIEKMIDREWGNK
jgi:DNA repair exonuclease SbcCD ATPase subunit